MKALSRHHSGRAPQATTTLAPKIESFACNYLAQRKADSARPVSDTDFLNAADNIRPCAEEVAETFVNALQDAARSAGRIEAKRFAATKPAAAGACAGMTTALRAKQKAGKFLDQWKKGQILPF